MENHRSDLLLDIVKKGYDVYSGLVLERYFQQKLWEEERFTIIGNWWDSKGENEIDIVAVNRIDRTARIAEVKINRNKISMPVLKEKSQKLIGELKRYQIEYNRLLIGGYVRYGIKHSHPYFMVRLSAGRYTMDYNMTRLELYISSIAFFQEPSGIRNLTLGKLHAAFPL